MNSFDFYDTLVARRSIVDCHYSIDDELSNLIPVREMISEVAPEDMVISDFGDPDTVRRGLREVCGLNNPCHVSPEDKFTGRAWQLYRPLLHTGDNPHSDRETAARAGIKSRLVNHAQVSPIEKHLIDSGFEVLGKLIREARLSSFDSSNRDVQLCQIQLNFPFLFLASMLLDRLMAAGKYTDALMSSRDCCLWVDLQKRVAELGGRSYRTHYFYTSRKARTEPSAAYLEYVNGILSGGGAVVVDLCGYGHSLPELLDRTTEPDAPVCLAVRYPHPKRSRAQYFVAFGDSLIERLNVARHPRIVDVARSEGTWAPCYSNPLSIDWVGSARIQAAHEAFQHTIACTNRYEGELLGLLSGASDSAIKKTMGYLLSSMEERRAQILTEDFVHQESIAGC